MSLKALKIAITIMTIMIFLGIILLFYGIAAKSSKLANQEARTVELTLPEGCDYKLESGTETTLLFAPQNKDCVLVEISKNSGKILTFFKVLQ